MFYLGIDQHSRQINKIRYVLRCHNPMWHMPTKTFPTVDAVNWLKKLSLPKVDRLEMDYLLADLKHIQQRLKEIEKVIDERCRASKDATLLSSMPGIGQFTAIALACRVLKVVDGNTALPEGNSTVTLDFRYDGGGMGKGGVAKLSVDGKQVAEGRIGKTQGYICSADETADVGVDNQTPVALGIRYGPTETKFTGKIHKIVVAVR